MTFTQTQKNQIFKELTEKMAETYSAKNHDYGNSFSETVAEFGFVAAATRMMDKMSRIKSFAKKSPEEMMVKTESLEDTLLDIANYAIMSIVELRQNSIGAS